MSFLAKVHHTSEEIEYSLQFNPGNSLMHLIAPRPNDNLWLREPAAAYAQSVLNLFDRPGLATALISLEGGLIKSNQRLHEILGTTAEDTIDLDSFVHSADRWLDRDFKRQLIAGEITSYTLEKRFVTQQQEIIWLNTTVSLVNLPELNQGNQPYLAMLLEDVTEHKKIYNALLRTEGKWKAVVLNSSNFFVQTSNTGQIINASSAVERILGYPQEELLGMLVLDLIHPSDLGDFASILPLSNVTEDPQPEVECRWRTKAGTWVYLLMRSQKFPAALEIDGLVLSGHDITVRKQLEANLKTSEAWLQSLLLNVSGVVFRCDSMYAMSFISEGIQMITGYPASEFINDRIQSFFDIIYPDDVESIKNSIMQAIFERQPVSLEYRIMHTDGQIHWVLERKQAVFDPEGNLLWLDGMLIDISDRK
jgi:PAS domain S-box-containing protein